MNSHVAEIVEQVVEVAQQRRPDDEQLRDFLRRYYRELPDDDADETRIDEAYAAAVTHLTVGRKRAVGETLVRVLSPTLERDGWTSGRSVLMFVTDDVPFLVDTVRLVLERHQRGIHLLVHPRLHVRRTDGGIVDGFGRDTHDEPNSDAASGTSDGDGESEMVAEAWTMIEIDRCDTATARAIEVDVCAGLVEVHRVVDDFVPMRARMFELAGDEPLLHWLADPHFVFLGAASYDRTVDDGGNTTLSLQPGSGLGEMRGGAVIDPAVIDPPPHPPLGDTHVAFARTERESTVHRSARVLCVSVRPTPDVEHRFFGLLGSGAYRNSVFSIPTIGDRAREVLALADPSAVSHTGRAVKHVLDTFPRDLVFEIERDALAETVIDIVGLHERRIVRVFDVAEPVGRWTTVLVYVPKVRFDAALPAAAERLVAEHYGGEVRDVTTLLGASSLARISMSVHASERADLEQLAAIIDRASRSWEERASDALCRKLGDVEGRRVWSVLGAGVPADYRAATSPENAVPDLLKVAVLGGFTSSAPALESSRGDDTIRTSIGRDIDSDNGYWRFKVAHRGPQSRLADLVPLLNHLGFSAIEQHPYEFAMPAGDGITHVHMYDLGVVVEHDEPTSEQLDEAQAAFGGLLNGHIEADNLNALILAAGLNRRQVAVLRTYSKYLQQATFAYGQEFIAASLARQPALAAALAAFFDARFSPDHEVAEPAARTNVEQLLDEIPSIADDRIGRALLALISATVRTNAARLGSLPTEYADGNELAVKLIPREIDFLPEPRPAFEIFVCSPWVEGVHLRGGPVARGGIRWSDRFADFRTEVLGLVKAQMVKNSVIVPEGAKGGFVVKKSTAAPGDRDAFRAEGVDRYQRFIGAMLDITDNLDRTPDGPVVEHPVGCVVRDSEDPYLVVAADKGTATFSDIANELAESRGFWLGDAFASGGSQGYDHKAMGITARGAWESVRRHARVLGLDADGDELTVVGVGDMSGDVFGNGMLLSSNLKVVAAFDHRHVFLDPDPDPAVSFAERQRLFELPRSSWADYDEALISAGGGVFPRTLKAIPLSAEVREILDVKATELAPDALMSAILAAPVDLLWNGGIGTFVKSSSESDAEVGDRANDGLRIDADDLRCKMVGEGGNLGFTQLARVEFAISGGLIYTDAIDNAGGVDCSDHEVNIKIALGQLVRDGEMTVDQRNALLEEMSEEVAGLVLESNRAQTLALVIARRQGAPMANVHSRYLDTLERAGELDRDLEFLPSDRDFGERQSAGMGLRAPEMAVLMAYTKNLGFAALTDSDVPDDPALEADLMAYFPRLIGASWPHAVKGHRLRREIIATHVINDMVNHAGISFDHRMTEDSGATLPDIVRAYVAARNALDLHGAWRRIDDLGAAISLEAQLGLFLDARRMNERATGWLLRHRPAPLDIGAAVARYKPGLDVLGASIETIAPGRVASSVEQLAADRIEAGIPEDLAITSARWPWLHTGFDIVELAEAQECSVAHAAEVYWAVFEAFEMSWLWDGIGTLPRSDRWQTQARSALRDDMLTVLAELAETVITTADGSVETWVGTHEQILERALDIHTEIRRADSFDLTTLSVGLRQLRNVLQRTRTAT